MGGHLATNQVTPALSLFSTVQSVDSARLAHALSQRATRPLPVCLEVNTAGEQTKYGFTPDQVAPALEDIKDLPHLDVRGLMTVAPMTADLPSLRHLFRHLRKLNESLGLRVLSMGMTDDFEVAVEEGSTLVRIGGAILGGRRPA